MKKNGDLSIRSVAVTGALGNLGMKLLRHLSGLGRFDRLVGLDLRPLMAGAPAGLPKVDFIQCDLADQADRRWRDVVADVDAVVHLAARNPYPEASWEEAAVSLDMTLFLADAAAGSGRVKRVVFASSNHVMGRYKDDPLWATLGPGGLRSDLPPAAGTIWHTGERWMDSTAYASAKLYGERACRSAGLRSAGRSTFVCCRIGWCQPGENLPATISAAGTPTQEAGAGPADASAFERAGAWFRGMWLSNNDFCRLMQRAILADGSDWPEGCVTVNGVSANRGMKWSLEEGRRWLDYTPEDDVYK